MKLRLLLIGLTALAVTLIGAPPAQAATYTYVSLDAVVTGSSVKATGVVKASSATTVNAYGIVVDKNGPGHHNLVAQSGVQITTTGTAITGTRTYAAGTYRYSIFVRETSRSAWLQVGPEKTFTVGTTPTPTPTPTPSPTPTPTPTPTPSPTPTPTPTPTPSPSPSTVPGGYTRLAFSDEFDGAGLDKAKWSECWFETSGNVCGAMNGSPTLKDHVTVSGGSLVLTQTGANEGALVSTRPGAGADVGFLWATEGYAEARVWFPGNGADCVNWPAWWANGPASGYSDGEHDIAEAHSSGDLGINYHYGNPHQQIGLYDPPGVWCDGFHTYGLHRKANSADVYWDGVKVRTYATAELAPQELIFNTGVWDDTSGRVVQYPASVRVDWVRVWTP